MEGLEGLDRTWELIAATARTNNDPLSLEDRLDPHLSWRCGLGKDLAPITEDEFVEGYWEGIKMALDDGSSLEFFKFMDRVHRYMAFLRSGMRKEGSSYRE